MCYSFVSILKGFNNHSILILFVFIAIYNNILISYKINLRENQE